MIRKHECLNNSTAPIWNRHLVLALGIPQLLITFISALFNSGVVLGMVFSKEFHKPIFILFCNLAISDFLCSSSGFWIAMLFITNPQSTVVGSKELLRAYAFYAMSILATIYNLVIIGVERYLAVSRSRGMRCRITRNQILSTALGIWVCAFSLGFMPLMGWNCLEKDKMSSLYSPLCMDYLTFITIPHCLVVLVLPLFTYLNIIIFLRKNQGTLGQCHTTYRLAEVQVARTSVLIWVLALFSYAPFFAGVVFDSTTQQCPSEHSRAIYIFRNFTAIMITINSLGDPIIYSVNMKKLGHKLRFLKLPSNNRIEVQVIGQT
ncbi:lysophosphatidic acid receptor 3-like [Erythrolamprus reginae]|uniref:lysophosphatidic acid receptor 3-like n=1 Tax=Erythrolamprus reginae TaxID=121349 RepID=UPI00396C4CBB